MGEHSNLILFAFLLFSLHLETSHFLVEAYNISRACNNVTISERDIFEKYFAKAEPWERPVKTAQRAISISVRLVLFGINEVSEREGSVRLSGFFNTRWQDEVHIWNKEFPDSCVYSMHFPSKETWIPEIAVLNSEKKYELFGGDETEKVRIFNNGSASYRPGGTFQAFCEFDLTYLPFDIQMCTLELESWRYVTEVQKLTFGDPTLSTRYWREHEQWSFLGGSYRKSLQNYLSDANYEHLTFQLYLQRKTGYYWLNVIIPSMVISFAQLSVFTLPIDEVIKVHVSFTCLLAYGVFQLMIIEDMPRSSEHIPLLSIYIDLSMSYIFLAICGLGLTFVCVRLAEDKQSHEMQSPSSLLLVGRIIGTCIGPKFPPHLQNKAAEESEKANKKLKKDFHKSETGQIFATLYTNIYNNENLTKMLSQAMENGNGEVDETTLILQVKPENNSSAEAKRENAALKKKRYQHEWEFLASVVDRFTCVLYVIVAIGTPVIMFGILPSTMPKPSYTYIPLNNGVL